MALVGHNGAGKTTLMKLMLGPDPADRRHASRVLGDDPAAGEFAGAPQAGLPARERLLQRGADRAARRWPSMPASSASRRKSVGPLLERVGLAAAADRRVGTYSKGMRQRLGLAQALLGEPRVLLLDEPTTGLDPALRLSFYEIVEELRGRGATVLLSSHALTELEERAGPGHHHEPRRSRSRTGRSTSCAASRGCRRASASR